MNPSPTPDAEKLTPIILGLQDWGATHGKFGIEPAVAEKALSALLEAARLSELDRLEPNSSLAIKNGGWQTPAERRKEISNE